MLLEKGGQLDSAGAADLLHVGREIDQSPPSLLYREVWRNHDSKLPQEIQYF